MDLYNAIAKAETGSEKDPWIRTKYAPPQGSTAYGPVQLTRSLAQGYLGSKLYMFSDEERAYLKKFLRQGALFARYGKEPEKGGYHPRYDYGGSGYLTSDEDKRLYKACCVKMMSEIFERNNEDLQKFWQEWRFGPKGGIDDRYEKTFFEELNGNNK